MVSKNIWDIGYVDFFKGLDNLTSALLHLKFGVLDWVLTNGGKYDKI